MRTLAAALSLLLAGCVTLDVAGESTLRTQYVLEDAAATPAQRATPVADSLLIEGGGGDPLADTVSIAYARRPGERALYQLATWTDRPSRRIPQLLQHRLTARGSFRAVAALGQPQRADWLLAVAVDDIHHDVATEPGTARLAVRATLFDRRQRTQVAQRTFSVAVPVAAANAAAAVTAMDHAVGQVFDQLVPWLESEVERHAGNR